MDKLVASYAAAPTATAIDVRQQLLRLSVCIQNSQLVDIVAQTDAKPPEPILPFCRQMNDLTKVSVCVACYLLTIVALLQRTWLNYAREPLNTVARLAENSKPGRVLT